MLGVVVGSEIQRFAPDFGPLRCAAPVGIFGEETGRGARGVAG